MLCGYILPCNACNTAKGVSLTIRLAFRLMQGVGDRLLYSVFEDLGETCNENIPCIYAASPQTLEQPILQPKVGFGMSGSSGIRRGGFGMSGSSGIRRGGFGMSVASTNVWT